MKNSKPSKSDLRTLKKAVAILESYERQQSETPMPRSALVGYNARTAINAINGFIRGLEG